MRLSSLVLLLSRSRGWMASCLLLCTVRFTVLFTVQFTVEFTLSNDNTTSFKNLHTFRLSDNFGNSYFFVRSFNRNRKGFFNIAKCEILAKDKSIPKGYAGIIPDAAWFSDEQVAELVGQQKERTERLERVESLLWEYIDFRQSCLRKPSKKGKLRLQKTEVSK
jgi:hypothetical protein